MGDDYRPVVNITVAGETYEISGFGSEAEAKRFIHNVTAETNGGVDLEGPY